MSGLLWPVVLGLVGALMLLCPDCWRALKEREYRSRLADRIKGGTDRYFEELRAIEAYDRPQSKRMTRITGVALIVIAAVLIHEKSL